VSSTAPVALPSRAGGAGAQALALLRRTWARRSWYGAGAVAAVFLTAPFLSTGYIALMLSPRWFATVPAQVFADLVNAALLVLVLSVADTAVEGGARALRTYALGLAAGALMASVLQWELLEALGMGTFLRSMHLPVEHRRMQMGFVVVSNLMVGGLLLWVHVQWRAARRGAQALHRAEHERHALAQQAETSRLLALQSRIEPQWLFDVMAHIRTLWRRDRGAGAMLLDDTIATLRNAMPPPAMQSTLGRERALVDGQLRIRGALHGAAAATIEVDIPPSVAHARFAPLLLWPLVQWLLDAQTAPTRWRLEAGELISAAGKPRLVLRLHSSEARWPDDATVIALLRTRLAAVHGGSAELKANAEAAGIAIELQVPLKQVEGHDAERTDR